MSQFSFGKLPIKLSSGQQIVGNMAISAIRWANPTAAASVTVTDNNNNTIVQMTGPASVQDVWVPFPLPIEVSGLGVGTIPNGTVYVYPA